MVILELNTDNVTMKKKTSLISVIRHNWTNYKRLLNADSRVLPNFMIIGTAKGGTTSLFNYLTEHPSVAAPLRKEISFFSTHFQKGINWYKLHFPTKKEISGQIPALITGEASPYYLSHPLAAARAKKILPNVKLIVLLRNPIDRAISNYLHIVRLKHEKETFDKAIEMEFLRTEGEEEKILSNENYFSLSHQYHSYLKRGLYCNELESWFKEFPKEQFLILNSEEFYENPSRVFLETINFLGLEKWEPESYKTFNKTKDSLNISAETKAKLIAYFKPHNEKLFTLISKRYNWDN
jgi:hypothetical protein